MVLFQFWFIVGLPWDLSEWIWKVGQGLKELTFFQYSANRGYMTGKASWEDSSSFVKELKDWGLMEQQCNTLLEHLWHHSKPRKIATLTWLILHKWLPIGLSCFKWVLKLGVGYVGMKHLKLLNIVLKVVG